MSLTQLLSFCVLICPSLCHPQYVSAPAWSISFHILTLSLLLLSLGSQCPFNVLVDFQYTNVFFPLCICLESEPFFCIFLCLVFSLLCFPALQLLFSRLRSFNSEVLLFFSGFIFVSPMNFQPPLCISSGDTHHTIIGTFPLYASVFSNIQNSDNSYSGPCIPFICLPITIPSDPQGSFGSGMFPIQIL